MGREVFAYRDLEDDLRACADTLENSPHYQSHQSPPPDNSCANRFSSSSPLTSYSESTELKKYSDRHRANRRRKIIGIGIFIIVALLAVVPMLIASTAVDDGADPNLELVLAAPYKALRANGHLLRHSVSASPEEDDLRVDRPDRREPNVGDYDPNDDQIIDSTDAPEPTRIILGDVAVEGTEDEPMDDDTSSDVVSGKHHGGVASAFD